MSENNGIVIGEDDVTLSITNPVDSQPVTLTLNHYRHWDSYGYSRIPIRQTVGAVRYSPFGVPVASGPSGGYDDVKHRFTFNTYLNDEELLALQGIFAVSENLRSDVSTNHQITLLDNRALFQEPGSSNTRFLAGGSVDNSTMPGFVRYFAGFYCTLENIQWIFASNRTLAGRAFGLTDGTQNGINYFPCWNVVFSLVEGDKLTP